MQTKIRGMKSVAAVEVDLKATEGGALHNADLARIWTAKGYGFQVMSTGAVAALVVRPSTLSAITLYNAEAGGGKIYVIERVMAFNLVSTAAAAFWSIWLCSHPVNMTAPTGNNITIRNNTRGVAAGGSSSILDTAETVADDGWFPWGPIGQSEATGVLPSGAVSAEVGGRIMVPPGAGLSVQVVSSAVGQTFTHGIHWFEVPQSELGLG